MPRMRNWILVAVLLLLWHPELDVEGRVLQLKDGGGGGGDGGGGKSCSWFGLGCSGVFNLDMKDRDLGAEHVNLVHEKTWNAAHPIIRRFLQMVRGGRISNTKDQINSQISAPTSAPFLSPSISPFFSPLHPPGLSPTPSPFFPPSPSIPEPAPSPIAEPPSPFPVDNPKFHPPPPSSFVPFASHSENHSPPSAVGSDLKHTKHHLKTYVLAVSSGLSLFLVLVAAFFLLCRANKVVTVRPWATGLSGQLQKAFVTGVPALKRSELEAACEDFSNVIGCLPECKLYKGTLSSGVEIAVVSTVITSAKDWSKQYETQFRKKIAMLSKVNHKNFANLIGYCEEGEPFTRMMVFEYAPNGTLFEHLHIKEAEPLDWAARLRVAMGIAYCLEHMNQLKPPVILRVLDSSSIYLTDDYAAKISDIGFWNSSKEAKQATGNLGPLDAPEHTSKTIMYKFGIVLLELLSGRLPFSEDDGLIEHWALPYLNGRRPLKDMVDPMLQPLRDGEISAICAVIWACIDPEPEQRPTVAEIARRLRDITAMAPEGATPKLSPLWWAELEILSSEAN